MTAQTLYVLDINIKTSTALVGLVFFSTLVIYALHRLVSLSKVDQQLNVERFKVIGQYKQHIQRYALLAILGGGICFFYLNWATQVALVLPALLSLGYVIPFLGRQKLRLRDIHFVKIFLIAIVWAYVTVLLPVLEYQIALDWTIGGLFLERCFFIFAITLPFDLRDWEIDKHNGVWTIPAKLGVSKTLYLAMLVLVCWWFLVSQLYPAHLLTALTLSAVSTAIFIYYAPQQKHDYYFTALMDGTMLLQYFLIWILS